MKKFIIAVLLFSFGCCAIASENIQKFTLDNGQTVIIKEVRSNPIVTVDTWIKTGSINEDDTNNGVSHFLEHLFFRGSKNHAPGEFDKILENKGAITNAATSKDFTHYYITIPSKFFDEALSLHSDMLLNPLLPRKELEKERKVVLEEIAKDENSPQHIVYENLISMLYTNHPYKRKVIGERSIIETIHRDNILDYYNKWYVPSNMVTVVVGDVNTQETLEKIKRDFNGNTAKVEKSSFTKEKQLTKQKRKVEYKEAQSGYMLIGFRGVNINNTDSYALDVLATILGDGRSSVFYRNIKDKLQLAFSISATNTGFRDDGIFYISANFVPEKQEKLENEIFKNIEEIQKNGVTEDQLNLAKNILERDTYYERESISSIAQQIGYVMVTSGDIKIYDNYVDNIKKVTTQDVKKAAQKYLGTEKAAISILLPSNSNEVKTSAKVQKQSTGNYATLSETSGQTEKWQLNNGSTLLLTPNTTNEIIALTIYAKGGNFTANNIAIPNMTAATLLKGTKTYSAQELSEILEDNGIKITPSSRSDAFVISVLTTSQQYDKTLELLKDILNNATFPEFEIEKVKKEKLNSIKTSRDIPLNLALEGYRDMIFSNTPYSNSTITLEKYIPNVSQADINAYYKSILNPKNIVISINGNVDKEKTINKLSEIFELQNNGSNKFSYNNYKNSIKEITQPKKTIKEIQNTNTDWILLGWQVAGLDNKKDYATLAVIDSLLGTGMSSRMFKNLRDQEGLAYQLGSSYSANALKGAFLVYIGTNPQTYDKALNGLWNEIKNLKTEFVGTSELQEAKDKLIGHFVISQETNMDKASNIGWHETAENNYKFAQEYETLINSVTENDIMQVANKYFKDSNYVLSVVKTKQ